MPNVVLLRGTSGSGKTTVARAVMAAAGPHESTLPLGPKGKLGAYLWTEPPLAVLGRYDASCGGCDGQSWRGAADDQEALLLGQVRAGRSVLLEGLMVSSWGVERLRRIDAETGGGLTVVYLGTSLEDCLAGVNARRDARAAARGRPLPPLNEENTRTKHRTLLVTNASNAAAGIRVEVHQRDTALTRTAELLGVALP